MNAPEIILMPGLDGTGELFAPLLELMPSDVPRRVLSYPVDVELSYEQLLALVAAQMPADRPVVLVAESFSGPVALGYAAAGPKNPDISILDAGEDDPPVPEPLD